MKTRFSFGNFLLICLGSVLLLSARQGQAHPLTNLDSTLQTNLPLIFRNAAGGSPQKGTLEGRVFNASVQDKPGLGNVRICIKGTSNCVNSNDSADETRGQYRLENLSAGSYQITAQVLNFYTMETRVYVGNGEITTQNFGMVARLISENIEMRVTVEWLNEEHWPGSDCKSDGYSDGCPTDMDAHIWGKFGGGDFHHFQCPDPGNEAECRSFLGDCAAGSAICVELFSFNGPGPETIAIRKATPGSSYYYGVQNYYQGRPGVPSVNNTGALVRIYRLDDTLLEYQASDAPQGVGDFWYLFSMDEEMNITLRNCLTIIPEDPDPNDSVIPVPECPAQ